MLQSSELIITFAPALLFTRYNNPAELALGHSPPAPTQWVHCEKVKRL